MKSGAIIANGTDVPVERIDPMANFHATITRKTKDGSVFYGDQKMTRDEALKSYTWNGAYAAKEESLKGSLAVGKLADITVLSKDIMTVPEDEIPVDDGGLHHRRRQGGVLASRPQKAQRSTPGPQKAQNNHQGHRRRRYRSTNAPP